MTGTVLLGVCLIALATVNKVKSMHNGLLAQMNSAQIAASCARIEAGLGETNRLLLDQIEGGCRCRLNGTK